MVIVSQNGRIFNFDTAHSVNFVAEEPDGYVARIYYWNQRENAHLPGHQYLVSFTLGNFMSKEAANEVYSELIEAFVNGDKVYRVPTELVTG